MRFTDNIFRHTPVSDRHIQAGICFILIIAILIAYYQVFGFGFLVYDTWNYVTNNPRVYTGITLDNIKWAFTTNYFTNWHPLTWLSYMLDMELWGLNPKGFHTTNLFFHICNSLLLFGLLQTMTTKTWTSAFVAGLFALHPLHIESVAWIAERKDVLCTFFFLLSILSYIKYVRRQNLLRYSVLLLTFFLGLMSKAMVVTLPAVLFLLDYWPLGRYRFALQRNDFKNRPLIISNDSIFSIILEKIPLFLLAAFGSWMTIIAQQSNIVPLETLSLSARIATAFNAYLTYIEKTLWPVNLSVLYPHPGMPALLQTLFSATILLILCFMAWRWRQIRPWFFVGWLWFLGTFIPVIGFIYVGNEFIADRYTYIPHIGFFIIVGWTLLEFAGKAPQQHRTLTFLALSLMIAAGTQTWVQLHYWQNDRVLWTRAIEVTPNNYLAENFLGKEFLNHDDLGKAKKHFLRSIDVNSQYADAYCNLGYVYEREGDLKEAITNYQKAAAINPFFIISHYRLAIIYTTKQRHNEAISHLQNVLALEPKFIDARIRLIDLLIETKNMTEAAAVYDYFLKFPPLDNATRNKIMELGRKVSKNIEKKAP
jgi:protein O-mannosyl-transferase